MNWLRKMMGTSGSHPAQPPVGGEPPLKTISYRGGLVTLQIPAHWAEEYEPEGGGTFYEDAPDSPTFRLQTITMKSPSPITAESAPDILSSLQQAPTAPVERLPSGCALIRYTQSAVDRGERLLITYWSVAHVVPPHHARIANFSYTLLERQRDGERFQRELELLDREVRASIFSPELGVTQHDATNKTTAECRDDARGSFCIPLERRRRSTRLAMRRAVSVAVTSLAVLSGYVCCLAVHDIFTGHLMKNPAMYLSVLAVIAGAVMVAVLCDWIRPTRRSVYSAMATDLLLLLWSLIPLCS